MATRKHKLWEGRFAAATAPIVEHFTASIAVDKRLAPYDIAGSLAHCHMLVTRGIISAVDGKRICRGLGEIEQEIADGTFRFDTADEDIHMAIERRLTEKIGPAGGRLHTARSRNDQVSLDLRLFVRAEIGAILKHVTAFQKALAATARKHARVVMPGYTHLQRAQPVLFAHHLLAYHEKLERDGERFADCRRRADVMPLGAGALAGTTFPIDPEQVARELRFARVATNSLDAVSERDFIVEFLAAAAILATHLSRLAEEIVLWSSAEFAFISLPDEFATGSSIMPQKKNPDVAELVRGKTGRVYGNLMAMLTILKGLPLAYNRDLQEDKVPLFDTVDTVKGCLAVLTAMVPRLVVHADRMREAAADSFLLATDVADYLVTKSVPFREAHNLVGQAVRRCLESGRRLEDLPLKEWRELSKAFGSDLREWLSVDAALARRSAGGGTAPANVARRLRGL
ncbi:MAG: argininosuccinate lyase [Deltaproteobacteria bacterium]|nr:argininosuccinate lyase [Deltaproteobacteria bacterium]